MTDETRRLLVIWLCICAAMVFAMVLLGGAVRLTGSGLSIVQWKPLMGILPPLNEQAWQQAFDQYKQFPEYKLVNHQIDMAYFKFIYIMEYGHRLFGRLIGMVFFIPFVFFLAKGKLERKLSLRLWALFMLGAIQGGIGWYMVKSGLVENPAVSQYRLTLHLMVAVLIYAWMIRCIVSLTLSAEAGGHALRTKGQLLTGLLLLMIASGGLMAGTHAGFVYNTFPDMGGEMIPAGLMSMQPGWVNFFENTVTIQFVHRSLAMLIFILVSWYALSLFRSSNRRLRNAAIALQLALVVQISLGISTLLLHVPLLLGVLHQAGALVLLTLLLVTVSSPIKPFENPVATDAT